MLETLLNKSKLELANEIAYLRDQVVIMSMQLDKERANTETALQAIKALIPGQSDAGQAEDIQATQAQDTQST